ncbi:MAG: hypothetical protein WAP23_03230 [Candidatus Spechtbacterales bacterium]
MDQKGIIALLIGMVAMFLASTLALSAVFVFLNRAKAARNTIYSYEAIYASEAGIEDILLRYFDPAESLPSSYPYIFPVGNASARTTLSEDFLGNATIVSEGDRLDRIRELRIYASPIGLGVFRYAVQIGDLGLEMGSNSRVIGNVYSNGNITGDSNSDIQGDASAVGTISTPRPLVTGVRTEGVAAQDLPQVDIDYWKAAANVNNNPIAGNVEYDQGSNALGPRKIVGNLTIKSNADFTVTGPIHVTGNFLMDSNAEIFLDNRFSASTTVIIVGGEVDFDSNSEVHATSLTPKGYIMFLSESTSGTAVELDSNNPIAGAVYAPNGTVVIGSNADITSIAGRRIRLDSNAEIIYDLGLRDADFSGGPSSGASIISWQEQ